MTDSTNGKIPTLKEATQYKVICEFCGKHKPCYSFELISSNIICKSCIKIELENLKDCAK